MCDTNKNVTKMGVIVKGVYYILVFFFSLPIPIWIGAFSFIKFGVDSSHRHNRNASKQIILGGENC